MSELPFRQIHLDFHTSPYIDDIGADFDAEAFAARLDEARVNSINIFARCHHGHIYYRSEKFARLIHPHLEREVLNEQIAACRKRGIKTPVYVTVQWDHFTAMEHPEWLAVDEYGNCPHYDRTLYDHGFYRFLCLNTPYVDFLKDFVRDLAANVDVSDGLWFDIVHARDCSCPWCRKGIEAEGLDPSDADVRKAYGERVRERFCQDMTRFVHELVPGCRVFYNAGHISPEIEDMLDAFTHLELESLPSGGWGYMHFPVTVRYARKLGKDYLGMTGKFHTSWGDFHSYKNQAALEFECFSMLAMGAKCCIGDQLPPRGVLCDTTYDLIGKVYSQVEAKERWCHNAQPVTEIAILTAQEYASDNDERIRKSETGAVRMLQEGGHQFDVVDSRCDFSGYRLLVLPDEILVNDALKQKLEDFVGDGGAIIATAESGLNHEKTAFASDIFGCKYEGPAPYVADFIVPGESLRKGMTNAEYVIYERGTEVTAKGDVLADIHVPYFNREGKYFCSHGHTPSTGRTGYPGAVRHGNVIYFNEPLFTQYRKRAPLWCKQLFLNAVGQLLPDPILTHSGPSSTIATVNAQDEKNRWVVHLLHYVPERRSEEIDVIEDVIPLHNLKLTLRTDRTITAVRLVPQNEDLSFSQNDGVIDVTVRRLDGHQMLELTFV